jgi:hypothetical protein
MTAGVAPHDKGIRDERSPALTRRGLDVFVRHRASEDIFSVGTVEVVSFVVHGIVLPTMMVLPP